MIRIALSYQPISCLYLLETELSLANSIMCTRQSIRTAAAINDVSLKDDYPTGMAGNIFQKTRDGTKTWKNKINTV